MNKFEYLGIEFAEDQEPTDTQIRSMMDMLNIDYYSAQEVAREVAYGPPPKGFDSWAEYKINRKDE